MQKAYLILENGTIFEGTGFGATGEAVGEIVFTTGMAGYSYRSLFLRTDRCSDISVYRKLRRAHR